MKIKLTKIYVNDQEKALRFYTEVLGFVKKADFTQGPFRWLTVASREEPDGTELQLALNDDPADGLTCEKAVEDVEADVPAGRAHRYEPSTDAVPEREARAIALRLQLPA